jgi:hypothetical protein
MELEVNQEKLHLLNVVKEPFDFLGFTFRYDRDRFGRDQKYLNIVLRKKSSEAIRTKIRDYLRKNRHKNPSDLSKGLNPILIGWANYFTIPHVSYPQKEKRNLRWYLSNSLYRYYRKKSQRKSMLYRHNAFEELVSKYGLVDPTRYSTAR